MKEISRNHLYPSIAVYLKSLTLQHEKILDFGSGAKRFEIDRQVVTYDPNPKAKADIQDLFDFGYTQYPLVYCNQVGEHVTDLSKLVRELYSVTERFLVFRCPHTWGPRGSHFNNWLRHWYKGNHDGTYWRTVGEYKVALELYFPLVIDMRRQRHPWVWPISHCDFLCVKGEI